MSRNTMSSPQEVVARSGDTTFKGFTGESAYKNFEEARIIAQYLGNPQIQPDTI